MRNMFRMNLSALLILALTTPLLAQSRSQAIEKPATVKDADKKTSWRQFNGSQGHAVGAGSLPTEWSETKNVAWKTPIPGSGWSSPIVDGDEVWLTTAIDKEHSLRAVCIDAVSGNCLLYTSPSPRDRG